MADVPELEVVLRRLEDLSNLTLDPDVPIHQLRVTSLDLVEWTVLLEDEYGLDVENMRLDEMGDLTVRSLYQSVIARQPGQPDGGGP